MRTTAIISALVAIHATAWARPFSVGIATGDLNIPGVDCANGHTTLVGCV